MGAKIKLLLFLFSLISLSACSYVEECPYVYISEGVYACGDTVWEKGTTRNRMPTDVQALQYVPDGSGISLERGELVDYSGTLYSLSNYRALLLEHGYVIESERRTCDVLDTTLSKDGDRVRLIYQPSGRIRILFENYEGAAHILLEGI